MEANEISFKQKFGKDLLTLLLSKYEQSQSFVTGIPGKMQYNSRLGKVLLLVITTMRWTFESVIG